MGWGVGLGPWGHPWVSWVKGLSSASLSRRGGGGTSYSYVWQSLDIWRSEMGQEERALRPGLLKGLQSHRGLSCS